MIEFGEKMEPIGMIRQLLATFNTLDSIDTAHLMRDRYETYFGIHNHDIDDGNPLALVSYRDAEDNSKSSRLYGRITEFAKKKIGKHWNMSLTEFMSLPRDVVEHIFTTADELEKIEQEVQANMLQGLSLGK